MLRREHGIFYITENDAILYKSPSPVSVKSGETVVLEKIQFGTLSDELGMRHPSTGKYSPVDQASWASASYALGADIDTDGNGTFVVYSKNATKILLEIIPKRTAKNLPMITGWKRGLMTYGAQK